MAWRGKREQRPFEDVDYHEVASQDHDELVDAQYREDEIVIPWGAIVLALVLCVGGAFLLAVGVLLLIEYIDNAYVDRTWPVITLGALMFVPGVYHVRVAYCAFRRRPGYSFDDIPSFD